MPDTPNDGDVAIDRSHDLYRRPAPPHAPEPGPPADSGLPPDPVFPDISSYWPDRPSEEPRSPFFYRRPAATAPPASIAVGPRPRRSRRGAVVIGLVLGVLVVAGAGTTVALLPRSDSDDRSEGTPAAPTERGAPVAPAPPVVPVVPVVPATTTLTAPVNGRKQVSFELVNGTSSVSLRSAALGDVLYRISTAAGSGLQPRADDVGNKVRLFIRPTSTDGSGALTIVLNAAVRWDLLMTGGTERSSLDLSAGGVRNVDLVGGAARIELALPRPNGALKVRMSGGVHDFEVRAPGSSVRVRAREGAGRLVLDGRTRRGVARNTSITPAHWADNPHQIDLDAVAGMGTLTVRTRSAQ